MSGESIIIEVAGKPVPKGRGRIGIINGHGMIYTPAKTKQYESMIKLAAGQVMGFRPPLTVAVCVTVHAYVPVPEGFSKNNRAKALSRALRPITKPDIDNYIKSALDGIIGVVIKDDNLVAELHSFKLFSERPRLRISVSVIEEPKPEGLLL